MGKYEEGENENYLKVYLAALLSADERSTTVSLARVLPSLLQTSADHGVCHRVSIVAVGPKGKAGKKEGQKEASLLVTILIRHNRKSHLVKNIGQAKTSLLLKISMKMTRKLRIFLH